MIGNWRKMPNAIRRRVRGCLQSMKTIKELNMSNSSSKQEKDLQGIRGWLLVVAVGVIGAPIIAGIAAFQIFPFFSSGAWGNFMAPSHFSYNPTLGVLVGFIEIAYLVVALIGFIAMLKFFKKEKGFPRLYIAVIAVLMALGVADLMLVNLLYPGEPLGPDAIPRLGSSWFWSLIWIAYIVKSKRVKATFIE
jgi:hypothetical protein